MVQDGHGNVCQLDKKKTEIRRNANVGCRLKSLVPVLPGSVWQPGLPVIDAIANVADWYKFRWLTEMWSEAL